MGRNAAAPLVLARQAVRLGPRQAVAGFAHSALPDLVAVAALALLPRLYFWRLFTSSAADQMTIVEGDFTQEYFPVLATAARALREGALPLWNPYSNGGQPLMADPQSALLYPPTWLALAGIEGFDGNSLVALERLIPLHFALAGVLMYALGRAVLGSRLGALVAALTFAYSGFLTSYPVQQLPILRSVVWFPLQVLGLWLALERKNPRWAVLGGLAWGLAILAGHPQTVFLQALALAIIAAVWLYQEARTGRGRGAILWVSRALGLIVVLGLGLSAVQWVPTLEFMRLSNRAEVGFDFLRAGFRLWELPMNLVAPRVLGGLPAYVGVLPLLLAALALLGRGSRIHGVAVALGVVGVGLSLGGHSFLYPSLYVLLPGFDLFRHWERSIFLFTLAMALLAGSGASLLFGRLSRSARRGVQQLARFGALWLLGALAVGGALYVLHLRAEVSTQGVERWRDIVHWYFFFLLVLAGALSLIVLRIRVRSVRAVLPALLVAVIGFDLFTVSWETNLQARRPDEVFRASQIVERLLAEGGLARVVDQSVLNGNHGLVYGIPTVTLSFPMHLQRFAEASRRLPQERLLDLLNVGYVVTREARPEYGEVILREPFQEHENLLYRRQPGSRPAYVVPSSTVVADADAALEVVAEKQFDLRERVVFERQDDRIHIGGHGAVLRIERGWNQIEADVQAPAGGYLVLSEVAYPGWRAWVDGMEAPLLQANYLLRAVWLPPGEHQVTLRYEPISMKVGAAATLATLAVLSAWALWLVGRSIRGRGGEGAT